MTTAHPEASRLPAAPNTENTEMTDLNGATRMQLLHEALSRVRMRVPRDGGAPRIRSARRIAMQVRHQQACILGNHYR